MRRSARFPVSAVALACAMSVASPVLAQSAQEAADWLISLNARLKAMPKLQNLNLYPFGTDAIVTEAIKAAPGLTDLGVHSSKVTDAAMADVAKLPLVPTAELSSLTYGRAPAISAKGWAALGAMPKLRSLNIVSKEPIGPEIAALAASKSLSSMSMMSAKIGDAGGVKFAGIASLRSLYLWKTEIGDATMAAIATLPNLHTLYLDGTKVSDAGLKSLAQISLDKSAVTDAGIAKLKEALPKANVAK